MKICIICRKEFTTTRPATKEHIIPESIGGNYIIETVCKDCNSKMGTKIDAPFVKNLISRLHIEENQIKGKKGIVDFPLKGNYQSKSGKKYQVNNFDSNPILLDDRPILNIEQLDKNTTLVSISFEKYGSFSQEELINLLQKHKSFLENEYKKNGLEFNLEQLINSDFTRQIQEHSPLRRSELIDFNPFFLEALKIAYEFFVTACPEFLDHPDIKNIAKTLENTDLETAKKYVALHIANEQIEYMRLVKCLKDKFGSIFIVQPLKIPNGGSGCFISLYEKFICLVQLSEDDLFGNIIHVPYIYIVNQKKALHELPQDESIKF
ncbi:MULTISPECIES: HNH endonuclease [Pasteurella]|uniref:HNH endonuclease n=1 Tax=Pasteurella TaxID=745 RepID=UPI0007761F3E|nr:MULTISPECIES: HNH endonuclease [Pasteurella]AMM82950.1 hypothetical protein AW43_11050 [Pasteurella multocida subsp. multocida PMTB2.1]APW57557.1 HNH endonuclease [Pasteurella multocida]ATC20999.1 HNH endonuclease [Pasteurella multocida]AXQ72398.1 hypothetical protein AWY89_05235 [Pasteurella multocida subsp. multocida]MCH4803875.1 HNH endonuclease [Pasteurella multocida]